MEAGSVGDAGGAIGGVAQVHIAFDADLGAEVDVAVDAQGVALEEGGGAAGEAFLEIGDVFL